MSNLWMSICHSTAISSYAAEFPLWPQKFEVIKNNNTLFIEDEESGLRLSEDVII